MPTIQSRKNEDNVHVITADTWKAMQENGMSRKFKIIDDSDIAPEMEVPLEITDFLKEKSEEPKAITLTVAELKELLDSKGTDYPKNARKQELIDLL